MLNIWDHVLPLDRIAYMSETCEEYIGNIFAWPDALAGINGRVSQTDRVICKGKNILFVLKMSVLRNEHL